MEMVPPGALVGAYGSVGCGGGGEEFCKACFSACGPGVGEDTGEQFAAAALALGNSRCVHGSMSTPTAVVVPMQTAAGTPPAHIPVVDVSPVVTALSDTIAPLPGGRVPLSDAQAAREEATDRQSQQRKDGRVGDWRFKVTPIKRQLRGRGRRPVSLYWRCRCNSG